MLMHLLNCRCLSDRGFPKWHRHGRLVQRNERSEGSLEKGRGCPRERNGNEAQLCEDIQDVRQARGRTDSVSRI